MEVSQGLSRHRRSGAELDVARLGRRYEGAAHLLGPGGVVEDVKHKQFGRLGRRRLLGPVAQQHIAGLDDVINGPGLAIDGDLHRFEASPPAHDAAPQRGTRDSTNHFGTRSGRRVFSHARPGYNFSAGKL